MMPTTLDVQTKKLQFLEEYLRVDDISIINKLSDLLHTERAKQYKELAPMTVEELEEKLLRSEQDIEEGRVYTHEEVKKYVQNRRKS